MILKQVHNLLDPKIHRIHYAISTMLDECPQNHSKNRIFDILELSASSILPAVNFIGKDLLYGDCFSIFLVFLSCTY